MGREVVRVMGSAAEGAAGGGMLLFIACIVAERPMGFRAVANEVDARPGGCTGS